MPEMLTCPIVEALVEVLETMAFVGALPAEEPPTWPGEARLATISFSRPTPGRIELAAPAAFGWMLAANIIGAAPDDPEAQTRGDDALRELMNVTCGNLLRRHSAASSHALQNDIPSVEPLDEARWQSFIQARGTQVLDADGQMIAIRLVGLE